MSSQDQSAQDMRHTPSSAGHHVPRQASGYEEAAESARPHGLVLGFTLLAAVLMILTGVMGFFEGLTAGLNGHFYVARTNYPFAWTVHGWGWVHIIIGVVLFAVGFALLMDRTWARVVGVVVASFSALANFLFIPYYPFWAILLVAMNAFIIWALVAPRGETRR